MENLIKYIKHFIKIFFFIVSPFLFLLIKLIKPFKIIRLIPVMTNRYGHLSCNLDVYLVEKKENKIGNNYIDIFITSRYGVCNYELLYLYKKNIIIVPHYILEPLYLFLKKILKNEEHTIPYFSQKDRVLPKYKPSIKLSNQQNKLCEDILRSKGINLNKSRIVCLFNRDDAYSKNQQKNYSRSWYYVSHHKYDINKFSLVAEVLSKKNIYLFRMGKGAENNCKIKNDKFIDYANSDFRSDLMDIYLASKCMFGMGGGTGSIGVALVFRKPFLDLVADVHRAITHNKDVLLLTKHYYSKKLRRNLTLKEILNYKYLSLSHREQLDKEGIEIVECSEQELVEATLEMIQRIDGEWKDTEEIIKLQNCFKRHNWSNLVYKHNGKLLHPKINANYSSNFLINNKSWLGL